MKKNMYRFAAMDAVVSAINDKIKSYTQIIESNEAYYGGDNEMPDYAREENKKYRGIIAELEDFINKL